MRNIVSITRFNRGEAEIIFDEVKTTGGKLVLENDSPVAVILTFEQYEAMLETLEDYVLFIEAENRLKSANAEEIITHGQMLAELGISEADLSDIDPEIF